MSELLGRRMAGVSFEQLGTWPAEADLGVYVVDENGRIVGAHAHTLELLHWTQEQLLGQDGHEMLHRRADGGTLPRAECPMMQAMLTSRPVHGGDTWFACGDGTLLPVSWLVSPCRWEDGTTGTMVVFHRSAPAEPEPARGSLSQLERLALLAETTTTLTATLNEQECVRRLVDLLLPRLADWVVVDLKDEQGEVWRTTVATCTPHGSVRRRHDLEGPMPPVAPKSQLPLSRALRGGTASLAGPEIYQGAPDSGIAVIQHDLFEATGIRSAAIAPVRDSRAVLGALTIGRTDPDAHYGVQDLSLLEDISRRAAVALSNSRLYQRQRRIAETMQRHLLPQLPDVPGLQMAARYLPAPEASQVGGDWYDAFLLPDGDTAVVIGDVIGHDLDAAAGMAQLRNMLRALTWSLEGSTGLLLDRLDEAVMHIADATMATLVLARVHREPDGSWSLYWSNAGHPPPLLVSRDGQARFLEDAGGLLLGSGFPARRTEAAAQLPPGSTLLLCTDGLIESPAHGIDPGLAQLRRHAAALAHRPLDRMCDLLLERVRPDDNQDDVALLALRVP